MQNVADQGKNYIYFTSVFAAMGNAALNPTWNIVSLYTVELFPTVVRYSMLYVSRTQQNCSTALFAFQKFGWWVVFYGFSSRWHICTNACVHGKLKQQLYHC